MSCVALLDLAECWLLGSLSRRAVKLTVPPSGLHMVYMHDLVECSYRLLFCYSCRTFQVDDMDLAMEEAAEAARLSSLLPQLQDAAEREGGGRRGSAAAAAAAAMGAYEPMDVSVGLKDLMKAACSGLSVSSYCCEQC
jgi:hypothetical protein